MERSIALDQRAELERVVFSCFTDEVFRAYQRAVREETT